MGGGIENHQSKAGLGQKTKKKSVGTETREMDCNKQQMKRRRATKKNQTNGIKKKHGSKQSNEMPKGVRRDRETSYK